MRWRLDKTALARAGGGPAPPQGLTGHDGPGTCAACQANCPVAANYCPRCGRALRGVMIRSATPVNEVMEKWRKLSFSLTRKEVRKLLGEPLRIEVSGTLLDTATETWTYEYETCAARVERVSGRVCISASQSRVIGWNEPHWTAMTAGGGADASP